MLQLLRRSKVALRGALAVLRVMNLLNLRNLRFRRRSTLQVAGAYLSKVRIDSEGAGHVVRIGDLSRLRDVRIVLRGHRNVLEIGESVHISRGCVIWLDGGSTIRLGSRTTIESGHLAAIEGRTLEVGRDAMLATDVEVRTGDSHSLLDSTETRVNGSADVSIADHVWLGARAMVLKGVRLPTQTTVAAGAIVTKSVHEPGCVLAGVPARVVKRQTTWTRD